MREEATPENVAARDNWTPNPQDSTTFDYLLDSDFGSIDIVPTISGTYEELAPRAVKLQTKRNTILVEAVSDLLATLTVLRRKKVLSACASSVGFSATWGAPHPTFKTELGRHSPTPSHAR